MPADGGQKPNDAIGDNEIVLRRIPTLHNRDDGLREVSKGSFASSGKAVDPEEGMSVDLLSILEAQGIDPTRQGEYAPDFEVIMAIRVAELHASGFWVVPRPIKADPHSGIEANLAHCNVLNVTSKVALRRRPS